MKQYLQVINSDRINRYHTRFTVGALVQGIHDACLLGIPSYVAHDLSRPIGWTIPTAVHFEPNLARAVSMYQMPESEDEWEDLKSRRLHHYYKVHIEPHKEEIEKLRQLLTDDLHGTGDALVEECVALHEPGLAATKFETLFAERDKDGLIPLRLLHSIGPGVYQYGDFALFAHRFFRRNLFRFNTLNYPVLQLLHAIDSPSATVKIALDPDVVGLAASYIGERLEYQYWWGPKFDDDVTSIPSGVTHHEADEVDRICFGISATQFRWGSLKNEKVFEAEEIRDIPSALDNYDQFGCRYVHSIVNMDSGAVMHLDGAIRLYSEDKMLRRLDLALDKAPRDTEYTKLWRVDGRIDVPTWKRLISDYFRDNALVGEYLGADKESVEERTSIESKQIKTLLEQYVPYSMNAGMGIRVTLSFVTTDQFADYMGLGIPVAVALDGITYGDRSHLFIESAGLELKKALRRLGSDLVIGSEVGDVTFRDAYVDLPLVLIDNTCRDDSFALFIQALKSLVAVWQTRASKEVICYKAGFPIDSERIAVVSVLGHLNDISTWLGSDLCVPPRDYAGLREWAERLSDYLQAVPSSEVDVPPLSETVMPVGILSINRRRVDTGKFHVEYSHEKKAHLYGLDFDEEDGIEAQGLAGEGIIPCIGMDIFKSRCMRCQLPYESCDCSGLLDDGVARELLDAWPFPFWTDRSLM